MQLLEEIFREDCIDISTWSYIIRSDDKLTMNQSIDLAISILENGKTSIKKIISSGGIAQLIVNIFVEDGGIVIDHDAVSRIGKLGVSVGIQAFS